MGKIYNQLTAENIFVKYSEDAGSYYCNYIFYKASQVTEMKTKNQHGFIHIPNKDLYKEATGQELDLLSVGRSVVEVFLHA